MVMSSVRPILAVNKRPTWHDLSSKFADQKECLASYLALEAAEVLEGAKPANLISIANRSRSCGRNLYELWQRWGAEVLAGSGLSVMALADRGDSVLLLLFSPVAIRDLLQRPNVNAVLKKAGYGGLSCAELVLGELAARMADGAFPHEIGVFLGYPLKDVAAFMGLVNLPFSCQGPWRIFGNPRDSLQLAETYRCCRLKMAARLAGGDSPFNCLRQSGPRQALFFGSSIENANQNLELSCVSH